MSSGSRDPLSACFSPIPLSYSVDVGCEVHFLNPLNGSVLATPAPPNPYLESQCRHLAAISEDVESMKITFLLGVSPLLHVGIHPPLF